MRVTARQARSLCLIVHELATNSAKYGALSVPDGLMFVSWKVDGERIAIDWQETGRSTRAPSASSSGFGTRLIEVMIRDLKGDVEARVTDNGYVARIQFPATLERIPSKAVT